jgi:hypothetical protein
MGFGPPRRDEVSHVAVPVGIDHRDFQTVDEADGVDSDFAVVETVVHPLDGWPLKVCSDVLALVSRVLWPEKYFMNSMDQPEPHVLTPEDWEVLLDQLASTA